MTDKKTVRAEALARRCALTDAETRCRSIHEKLFATEAFNRAKTVMVYLSYKSEVDTCPIVEKCFASGKKVCVPVVKGDTDMIAVYIKDTKGLVKDRYGISEPSDKSAVADKNDIDLCVVPGSAFDENLNRMGYGKGYYDRFLAGSDITKIALAFDCQIVERVPCQSTDVKMDGIITESRVLGNI